MEHYGIDRRYDRKTLKHQNYKYLKREWKNGGWVYTYADDASEAARKQRNATKLTNLEKSRVAGAASERNRVYNENKAKAEAEAKKKAEAEAEAASEGVTSSDSTEITTKTASEISAEERAKLRNERIAAQRDAAYKKAEEERQKKKKLKAQIHVNKVLTRNYLN